jgi:hypothetical protein
VIAEAVADWDSDDRATLARLLTRFVAGMTAITDPHPRKPASMPRPITQIDPS